MSVSIPRILDPSPLLIAEGLVRADVQRLLNPYGFVDPQRADANLQAMAGEPRSRRLMATILADLLEGVAQSADPDQALNHWEQFLQDRVNRIQLFEYLGQAPRILALLCTIFGNSPSLAQTLIRDPMLLYWLAEEQVLGRGPSRAEVDAALRTMLRNVKAVDLKLDALRRFRRREMLRIGVRDLLRLTDVPHTTAALSDLAGVLIQAAYDIVKVELEAQYGSPMHRDERGRLVETGFAVIAMGKLGGGELNFSSDVDLIYVYGTDEGKTKSPRTSISNEEYFEYLSRGLTRALSEATHEGYVFRVDLRLRAEGTVGRLARSLEAYRQYYRMRGQGWERLALLKARPIAGDITVGRNFLRAVRPFVFRGFPDGAERKLFEEVRAIKEMIDGKIAGRGETGRNVKLGTGGIREIEFIVQSIQAAYGRKMPGIRARSTVAALRRFHDHGLLSENETRRLTEAYHFLRDVEHKLQMVHDFQTHALPDNEEELIRCAIRLGYSDSDRHEMGQRFLADHRRHTQDVNRVFRGLFYSTRPRLLTAVRKAMNERAGG
jgi:glutamate-ammonia-ligase adenylyltransferase